MNANWIFLPLLVQILLTVAVYVQLARVKARAVAAGDTDEARRALHADAWPDYVQQVNNNIRNQFEVPVLFYVLVLVLWATGGVTAFSLALAWLFVATRVMHAWVHVTSNFVPLRRRAFMLGCLVVLLLAVCAAWAVFQSI